PGPEPYMGWKWSKPQTPSKCRSSAKRARETSSSQSIRCCAMSRPKRMDRERSAGVSGPRWQRGMATTPKGHVGPSSWTAPAGRIIDHMREDETISVLVVDDSAAYRGAARAVVDLAEGFTCVADAENGEDALTKARALNPALVLMDVNMPGIGGCEAARRLRAELPRTVVMLMSTYDSIGAPGSAEGCGASYYLRKEEFSPEMLRRLWDRFVPPKAA